MDFRFGLVVMLCLLGLANGVTPYFDCGKLSHPEKSLTWLVVLDCVGKRFHKSFSFMQYLWREKNNW